MNNKEDIMCPHCKVEMVIGIAIDPGHPANCIPIVPWDNITYETMKIIDCLKCPKCGYSDDGKF